MKKNLFDLQPGDLFHNRFEIGLCIYCKSITITTKEIGYVSSGQFRFATVVATDVQIDIIATG